MIPHIIHYCWFGRGSKPDKTLECIESWKRNLPDYEIIEWNEDNFPVDYCKYTKEAYQNKKYAFVSDVARLFALEKMGGIYLDTDVEVKRNFDEYLMSELLGAFESNALVATCFIAAVPHNSLIRRFLDSYKSKVFETETGFNMTANTVFFTRFLVEEGLVLNRSQQRFGSGITIYPTEIFGAFDADTMAFCANNNTVLIHHCQASWMDPRIKFQLKIKRWVAKVIGMHRYQRLKKIFKEGKCGQCLRKEK